MRFFLIFGRGREGRRGGGDWGCESDCEGGTDFLLGIGGEGGG